MFELQLRVDYIGRRTSKIWRTVQHCNIPLEHEENGSLHPRDDISARKEEKEQIEEEHTLITEDNISTVKVATIVAEGNGMDK